MEIQKDLSVAPKDKLLLAWFENAEVPALIHWEVYDFNGEDEWQGYVYSDHMISDHGYVPDENEIIGYIVVERVNVAIEGV